MAIRLSHFLSSPRDRVKDICAAARPASGTQRGRWERVRRRLNHIQFGPGGHSRPTCRDDIFEVLRAFIFTAPKKVPLMTVLNPAHNNSTGIRFAFYTGVCK